MGSCCPGKEKPEDTQAPSQQQPEKPSPAPPRPEKTSPAPQQTVKPSSPPPKPEKSSSPPPKVKNSSPERTSLPSQQPPPPPNLASAFDKTLIKIIDDIRSYFTLGEELDRGQYGVTCLCVENDTGQSYACKTISKGKLVDKNNKEDVNREIQIVHHLKGQQNIVEFKGAYEDKQSFYIVMELCAGGELFDHIIAKGYYSERMAASICKAIVNAVHRCHSRGVIHRDLKPENFLFAAEDKGAMLKLTDFGLSVFMEEGKFYEEIVGSAYFVAPEVLRNNYGKEIDIWSAGVILYILLSGVPPFLAETERGIFDAILQGDADFNSAPWPSISSGAKDLVRNMLKQDPKKRITSAQALEHPWIKKGGEASGKAIDSVVLSRLKQFRAMNKLKKLAMKVIAENLSNEEIKDIKQMFENLDPDNRGTITYQQLKSGLGRLKLSADTVKQLLDAAHVVGNGTVNYIELVTATIHRHRHKHRLEREENLSCAFQYLDQDRSGLITRDGLKVAMKKHRIGNEATIKEIISELFRDNDGKITYDEFCTMMRSGHQNPTKRSYH